MAKLDISFIQKNGATHSTLRKRKDDKKITFYNDDPGATLTVTVNDPNALCEDDRTTPAPPSIVVGPGDDAGYKICQTYSGEDFKYTAQIGNSTPEDPIIIMDHAAAPILTPIFLAATAAFIGGAALGAYAGMRLAKRRSLPAP